MKMGSKDVGGSLRFRESNLARLVRVHFDRAAIAGGEVEVVRFKPGFLQEEEGAGPEVLDVIGVGKNGEGSTSHG